MSKPIVAVVGRPNVGKSTLFNKLCGQRLAIVEDTPGITRDRIFANCEWNGHEFLLVDTGGIEPKATEGILAHMREQAQIAIDTADCIIMVTDVRNGLTAADEDVAHMLRRSHKPIILAVNKCDKVGEAPMELYEFYNLGFDEVMPISSVHGHGTGDLLDAVCAHLDFSETVVEEDRIPVAIIGRPNVGKSSLTNRILGENRMIVANEAGTTRDAIDTPVDNAYGKFIFTDTAGLRKRSNISDGLERYMVVRALAAVERSRVALILVDATVGFTEQDSKVAGYAHEQGKACIIVVNKWDAVEGKETNTMELQRRGYAECFSFMGYAPIIFISAQTGYNVNKLMQLIRDVDAENGARVPTGVLNEMLARATARMQPPSDKGRRLKIYYLTQASTRPPTFVAFVNAKHLFHFSYQRYLINQIREKIGMVFQHFNLFPNMTVLENCNLAQIQVLNRSKEEAEKTSLMYLERVGLADKKDAYPNNLSGGQKQRVAIARALCMDPEVLLFDEPTSALDPELVAGVLDVIKDLAKQHTTMLIVTHEMKFAKNVADEVVFMEGGHIVEMGLAHEVFENPKEERTRQFLSKNNE